MKKYAAQIKLDKFVIGGQTIGKLPSGKKVFVWGGLPGEIVEIEVYKEKSSYVEAIVTRLINASSQRIEPRDNCYLSTSPWQIVNYDYELEQKINLVREAFLQQKISLPNFEIITDYKQFNYRNKMEYALYWDNEENCIKLALHKRGSHQKIPIESSSIERPEILSEAKSVINKLNAHHEPARKYQSLLVRCNQDGEVSSALFENGKSHPKAKKLSDYLLGMKYSYSPNGFFQINLPVYEMALSEIKQFVATDKVIDLYSGVGTIGLSVAAERNLTLIETDRAAFDEMKQNVAAIIQKQTDRHGIVPVHAKSEDALDYITSDTSVIVDPPRAGLHDAVIDKFCDVLPETIIYLSCNPTTQARDIAKLLHKYSIAHIQAFNFFPRTPHIENLVVLKRL